jgi:hypothetical protein
MPSSKRRRVGMIAAVPNSIGFSTRALRCCHPPSAGAGSFGSEAERRLLPDVCGKRAQGVSSCRGDDPGLLGCARPRRRERHVSAQATSCCDKGVRMHCRAISGAHPDYMARRGRALPSPEARVFISSADWMPRNLDGPRRGACSDREPDRAPASPRPDHRSKSPRRYPELDPALRRLIAAAPPGNKAAERTSAS